MEALLDPKAPTGCYCKASAKNENKGDHLVLVEDGRITSVVSLPPWVPGKGYVSQGAHQNPLSGSCCHVAEACLQRGDITEDVELEMCMEEACCILPMATLDTFLPLAPYLVGDHEHHDGCGHKQVLHGDHRDWLVPLDDGSYLLTHTSTSDHGGPQLVEHGRLVKVGELKRKPSPWAGLFSFRSPTKEGHGYARLREQKSSCCPDEAALDVERGTRPGPGPENSGASDNLKTIAGHGTAQLHPSSGTDSSLRPPVPLEEMVYVTMGQGEDKTTLTKTVLNVMAICCPAEDKLIRSILEPLPGIQNVSVNFTTKSAAVLHNPLLISDGQIVKLLNAASLDASIKQRGELKTSSKWPSPWVMVSGLLIAIALFQYLYSPLKWVALGSVAIGLLPMLRRSMAALRQFVMDINVLMAIAVVGATALGDYLEAGGIVFLFALAMWLESRSSDKARSALASVLNLAPQFAVLLETGAKIAVEDVKVGTLLAVKAGELIPVDGVVVSGKSCIDESSLTGESLPVEKEPDSTVWAGTVNMTGYLTIRTSTLAGDSAIARMVKLVEEAQSVRSRTEQFVDKFAKYYTPVVVAVAILVAVIPAAIGVHNVRRWLYLSLIILVGACPCALVVSAPVTATCGLARAAKAGLLVKGASFLEALGSLRCIALDKTGTLTEGHFRVLDAKPVNSHVDLQELLYWMAAVEKKASHPMAAAIVAYARLNGVEPAEDVADFDLLPGEGVTAVVAGRLVRIGNLRLATRLGWHEDAVAAPALDEWRKREATVGWVGVDEELVGVFCVGDEVRPEAAKAVVDLKAAGVSVAMLTGDSQVTAQAVRRQVGEMDVHSELLPGDKVRWVEEMKKQGVTAMVGDGINDAPALATADIGIAMGVAGSAVAMETADVALMTNDLTKIAAAVLLGQACRRIVQQNIVFSLVTKALVLGLASAGYAALWAAVVADVGTCLLVTINGLRLLSWNQFKKTGSDENRQAVRPWLTRLGLVTGGYSGQKRGKCEKECCSPRDRNCISGGAQTPLLPCCSLDEEMGIVVCQSSSLPQVRRRLASTKESDRSTGSVQVAIASSCTANCCVDKLLPVPATASCSKGCCGSTPLPVVQQQVEPAAVGGGSGCAKQCCAGKGSTASFQVASAPPSTAKSRVDKLLPLTEPAVSVEAASCSKGCCGSTPLPVVQQQVELATVGGSSKCAKQCCGGKQSTGSLQVASSPPQMAKSSVDKPLAMPAAAVSVWAATCSKGCCGSTPLPVVQQQVEPPTVGGSSNCAKQCCGGKQSTGPLQVASPPAPVAKCSAAVAVEAVSCSKGCCGSTPLPVVQQQVEPATTGGSSKCAKQCCGGKQSTGSLQLASTPAPMAESSVDKLLPLPAVTVSIDSPSCSKGCCGSTPPPVVQQKVEPATTGASSKCAKKCCGGKQSTGSLQVATSPPRMTTSSVDKQLPMLAAAVSVEKASCSKGCCGGTPPPVVQQKVEPATEGGSSKCAKQCCAGKRANGAEEVSRAPTVSNVDRPKEADHMEGELVKGKSPSPPQKTCAKQCCGPSRLQDGEGDKKGPTVSVITSASVPDTASSCKPSSTCTKKCCPPRKEADDNNAPVSGSVQRTCSKKCCGGN